MVKPWGPKTHTTTRLLTHIATLELFCVNTKSGEFMIEIWLKYGWNMIEIWLKTDAILLSDIFEHFRELCLSYYELDPCHYVSLPGFTWDAMLKMTQVEIELISDAWICTHW